MEKKMVPQRISHCKFSLSCTWLERCAGNPKPQTTIHEISVVGTVCASSDNSFMLLGSTSLTLQCIIKGQKVNRAIRIKNLLRKFRKLPNLVIRIQAKKISREMKHQFFYIQDQRCLTMAQVTACQCQYPMGHWFVSSCSSSNPAFC